MVVRVSSLRSARCRVRSASTTSSRSHALPAKPRVAVRGAAARGHAVCSAGDAVGARGEGSARSGRARARRSIGWINKKRADPPRLNTQTARARGRRARRGSPNASCAPRDRERPLALRFNYYLDRTFRARAALCSGACARASAARVTANLGMHVSLSPFAAKRCAASLAAQHRRAAATGEPRRLWPGRVCVCVRNRPGATTHHADQSLRQKKNTPGGALYSARPCGPAGRSTQSPEAGFGAARSPTP